MGQQIKEDKIKYLMNYAYILKYGMMNRIEGKPILQIVRDILVSDKALDECLEYTCLDEYLKRETDQLQSCMTYDIETKSNVVLLQVLSGMVDMMGRNMIVPKDNDKIEEKDELHSQADKKIVPVSPIDKITEYYTYIRKHQVVQHKVDYFTKHAMVLEQGIADNANNAQLSNMVKSIVVSTEPLEQCEEYDALNELIQEMEEKEVKEQKEKEYLTNEIIDQMINNATTNSEVKQTIQSEDVHMSTADKIKMKKQEQKQARIRILSNIIDQMEAAQDSQVGKIIYYYASYMNPEQEELGAQKTYAAISDRYRTA